jgi:hypothetical protein
MGYSLCPISNIRASVRRCLIFLEDAEGRLNGKQVFDCLDEKLRRDLLSRFEHWIDGQICDQYHHGWNEPSKKVCYCFRWKRRTTRYRLYGFLCNPDPGNPRLQVCVLAIYAQKNTAQTDNGILKEIINLACNEAVLKLLETRFSTRTHTLRKLK